MATTCAQLRAPPALLARRAVASHAAPLAAPGRSALRASCARSLLRRGARNSSRHVAAAASGEPPEGQPAAPKAAPPTPLEDEPPWVRRERERELQAGAPQDLPFGVYLLASVIVAIAATGSIYEYSAGNAIFGVVPADSVLYTPILGLFVFTGFPLSGYLFTRCVAAANADAERMDKLDGL